MRQLKLALLLTLCLSVMLSIISCSDERTEPTKPEADSYTETQFLADRVQSNGDDVTVNFTVRDEITAGKIILFCFFQSDAELDQMSALDDRIDQLKVEIDSISAVIFDRWLSGNLTPADSIEFEDEKLIRQGQITDVEAVQDSLDTWLDGRYIYSVKLDNDIEMYTPNAVYLDSEAVPYLANETIAWGQGNYTALEGTDGWYGRRIELDLDEFWVADPTWINPVKPSRDDFLVVPAAYPDRYTQYELLPVRNWLERFTPGTTHTLHFSFGSPGTVTQISASLYLIYRTAE